MVDVTGPISTLPGAYHSVPDGMMCDDHSEVPAVRRVQGETDSMGSEMRDMCQPCLDQYRIDCKEPTGGQCDYCKTDVDDLKIIRDPEEGSAGPVYYVCTNCADKQRKRLEEDYAIEMDRYGFLD